MAASRLRTRPRAAALTGWLAWLVRPVRPLLRPLLAPVRRAASAAAAVVTPLGRIVAVIAALTWLAGWLLGWIELMWVCAACLTVLAVGLAFTIGRLPLVVTTTVDPLRVRAGESSRVRVRVANRTSRPVLPCAVEVGVSKPGPGLSTSGTSRLGLRRVGGARGRGTAAGLDLAVPLLAAGAEVNEQRELPTSRRGVVLVGPARTLRRDPLGVMQRSVVSSSVTELFVHPRWVSLGGLGAGLLRDLEGRQSDDTSNSDVELHTLREYVPGDDLRHIHWRTSARRLDGSLMVRQFVDTRRSQVLMVQSGQGVDFADQEEFETAVEVTASLALRGVREKQELTLVACGRPIGCVTGMAVLDGLARLTLDAPGSGLVDQVMRGQRLAQGATVAILVVGSATTADQLQACSLRFGPDVRLLVIRVDLGRPTSVRPVGSALWMSVRALDELPRALAAVIMA